MSERKEWHSHCPECGAETGWNNELCINCSPGDYEDDDDWDDWDDDDCLCGSCGTRCSGWERCGCCGVALCHMCFECGAGFCGDDTEEDWKQYAEWMEQQYADEAAQEEEQS